MTLTLTYGFLLKKILRPMFFLLIGDCIFTYHFLNFENLRSVDNFVSLCLSILLLKTTRYPTIKYWDPPPNHLFNFHILLVFMFLLLLLMAIMIEKNLADNSAYLILALEMQMATCLNGIRLAWHWFILRKPLEYAISIDINFMKILRPMNSRQKFIDQQYVRPKFKEINPCNFSIAISINIRKTFKYKNATLSGAKMIRGDVTPIGLHDSGMQNGDITNIIVYAMSTGYDKYKNYGIVYLNVPSCKHLHKLCVSHFNFHMYSVYIDITTIRVKTNPENIGSNQQMIWSKHTRSFSHSWKIAGASQHKENANNKC
ncbi:hypothetical protein ACJX0J_019120 [Zea mays]